GGVPGLAERIPRSTGRRLAVSDHEVTNVEMHVAGHVLELRDPVDVEVERPRRAGVQRQLERGLFPCFAQRRRLERLVRLLEVSARLQQPAELHVLDQAGADAFLVDDEGGRGEVRGRLVSRERLRELADEAQHRAAVRLLARVAGDVHAEQAADVFYSYWSASRMFRRDARRAGKMAARMPTKIAASAKTINEKTGNEKTMKSTL